MYFEKGLNDFGIVLKGASVARLPKIVDNYQDCYMVNNFDRNADNNDSEWTLVAPLLSGKNVAHFVNRLETAPLLKEHYEELNIKHIQFTKTQLDQRLSDMKGLYESYNLTCHTLPEELLEYNSFFTDKYYMRPGDSNYAEKHPNTGVLSIIYAAHILKPKNLWIAGLDFYQNDYLFRRPWIAPLKNQQLKMRNTQMVEHFVEVIKKHPDINFKMITNANLPPLQNLEIIE
tara:strand:- start:552 stop:1244 length:693 start_codon:yes stop_codon:yes gene_type:complete